MSATRSAPVARLGEEFRTPEPIVPRAAFNVRSLRLWGVRSAASLIDQAFTSLAGFTMSSLLAGWLTPEVYGAYAVALAGYIFFCGFYVVVILEPLSVLGPSRHSDRWSDYFRNQFGVHIVLVGVAAVVTVAGGLLVWRFTASSTLGAALMGCGIALPFLLLLWMARRMCYAIQKPSLAMVGSGCYLAIVVCGLGVLHRLGQISPWSTFLLAGCGSALGSCLIFRRIGITRATPLAGNRWYLVARENWSYGRWLAGSAVLYGISTQIQLFLLASLLGLKAAGIIRAMQIPSLLMTQIVTAASLLLLPSFSSDSGRADWRRLGRKAKLASATLAFVAACFAATLAAFAGPLENLLFRGKYSSYAWLMPVFALIPVANAASLGYSMALRATQKPHFDLLSNVIAAPIAVVSAYAFIHWWGLAGAAVSMVISFVLSGAVVVACAQLYARPKSATATAHSFVLSGTDAP